MKSTEPFSAVDQSKKMQPVEEEILNDISCGRVKQAKSAVRGMKFRNLCPRQKAGVSCDKG